METLGLCEGEFGFSPLRVIHGDYSLYSVQKNAESSSRLKKAVDRRMAHVQNKMGMAEAMAGKIKTEIEKVELERKSAKPSNRPVANSVIRKDRGPSDTLVVEEIEFNTNTFATQTQHELIPRERSNVIQTAAKSFTDMEHYLEEKNKRKAPDPATASEPKRIKVSMKSFDAQHQRVSDLADRSLEYAKTHAKKVKDNIPNLNRFIEITPAQVQNILFIPFNSKQKPCVKGNLCQSLLEPLRHPLLAEPCMGFFSPIVWDAMRKGEKLTPLHTEAEQNLFQHDMCEFCFRHYITEQVGKNMLNREQIPAHQIVSRHYSTDLPGSWDKSAMIAPERDKKTQHLHGLMGNVPFFNPQNFRPMVAVMNQEWEVQNWIEVEDFKMRKAEYATTLIAYGWLETGPFYELNNMMQPKVNQQDPYLNVITTIKGGYNISTVLAGYFKNCEGHDYAHVFLPFEELLEKNVFTLDYPGFHPKFLAVLEEQGRLRNEKATDLYAKFWPWNEGYAIHSIDSDPPLENHRIYYTAIWVLNALIYLAKLKEVTASMLAKLDAFTEMYLPLLNWMHGNSIEDSVLRTTQIQVPKQKFYASVAFALLPRHGEMQKRFRIEDFQYLEFQYTHFRRATPEKKLNMFYCFEKQSAPPHSEAFLAEYAKFDQYLGQKRGDPYNCYGEITSMFREFHSCLRRYVAIEWPADTISYLASIELDMNYREDQINSFFDIVFQRFVHLLALFQLENSRYLASVPWVKHVACSFDTTLEWIGRCLTDTGTAHTLFKRLGVDNFNHLLPTGFVANSRGINGRKWVDHQILLAVLVRVFVAEEMHKLEDIHRRTLKNNWILLRNSHFALLRAILENGYLLPVKSDMQLRERAAIRPGLFNAEFTRNNQLTLSIFEANYPFSTREICEGQLPRSYCMLGHNFFSELERPSFPFQKILSTTTLKCGVHTEFFEILNSTEKTPLKRLLFMLIEMSLKGLYKSANVVPGFLVSMKLDEIFRNMDCSNNYRGLIAWLNTSTKTETEKIDFQNFVDHLYVEYAYFNLQCNPTTYELLLELHKDEFWARSLATMDIVRTVLNRRQSLKLEDIYYYTQEKFEIKASHKILRPNRIPFWTFQQFSFIQSDRARYSSRTFCDKISDVDAINIQYFVRHLNPNGVLHKEDLSIPFNGQQALVECVSNMYEIYKNCSNSTNIGALTKQAVSKIQEVPVAHYPLLARTVTEIYAYQKYRSTEITDLGFVEKIIETLCANSLCSSMEELPINRTTACIAPCCSTLKKSLASKQFKPIDIKKGAHLIVHSTLGNRDLALHPADRRITCGNKDGKQSRSGTQTSIKQRSKKNTSKATSLAYLRKSENLKLIALGQEDKIESIQKFLRDDFTRKEETINKKVENQRVKEGIGLVCESTEPLILNALGVYIECQQGLKINGSKRREALRVESLKKQRPDPMRVQFNNRSQIMPPGLPPLIISPCCGELTAYNFLGYTGAGYCCGWCRPMANEFSAFKTENICELCYRTLTNAPLFNRCPMPNCATEHRRCPHGAFPILMYDDLRWMCVRKVYACDSCFRKFQQYTKIDFFYTLSMVKDDMIDTVQSIVAR